MAWGQVFAGAQQHRVGDDPYTQLCVADRPFDRRLKTKFGSDVGKFLRVHVAPVQGEKAQSREASCAEVDLWHPGIDPDLDQATFDHCPDRRWHLWLSGEGAATPCPQLEAFRH